MKNQFAMGVAWTLVVVLAIALGLVVWQAGWFGKKSDDPTPPPTTPITQTTPGNSTAPTIEDLDQAIAALPDPAAVKFLWDRFAGVWVATDNIWVAFSYENGVAYFGHGLWETEYGRTGELVDIKALNSEQAELTIHFPAVAPSELNDGWPEVTVKALLDMEGIPKDGRLKITTEVIGTGRLYEIAWAGATMEEAYIASH
ncbi:MAG: hypothetical protein LBE83_10750 [Propionibacteriaceae bacterium]|jgi:hypothetical protein|nr:hypothetical protein [Propionibacteriaceae bacterium]